MVERMNVEDPKLTLEVLRNPTRSRNSEIARYARRVVEEIRTSKLPIKQARQKK